MGCPLKQNDATLTTINESICTKKVQRVFNVLNKICLQCLNHSTVFLSDFNNSNAVVMFFENVRSMFTR